jgi:ABC-2 type transport system permease protein
MPAAMFALIRFEIRKILVQKKSWMGVLTILFINSLFAFGFYMRNSKKGDQPHPKLDDRLIGEFMNAFVYTQTILAPTANLLFPMILGVIGGYILAGEMEVGSIRMMLFRPISRMQILISKFVALAVYSGVMLVVLGVTSYGVACIFLEPSGDMVIPGPLFMIKGFFVHPESEALPRILLSYLLAWPMLMSVAAMSLMFAMITRHFTSAAILTTTVYFCSYIVQGIDLLSSIHRFLPTRYLPFYRHALEPEIPWDTIAMHAMWTGCYTAAFLGLAAAVFSARDM